METQEKPIISYEGKWGAMLAISLGVFMGSLDMSIINISLPTLLEQLDTKFATIQWVVIGYNLVITSTMLGAALALIFIQPHNLALRNKICS